LLQESFHQTPDNEIVQDIVWLGRIKALFIIMSFLVLDGVFQMLLVSFYIHFLKKEKKKKSLMSRLKTWSPRGKKKEL